jgi:hypothetical protein
VAEAEKGSAEGGSVILGKLSGGDPADMAAGRVYLSTVTLTRELRLAKLTMRADGGGASQAAQAVRGVVVDATGAIHYGDELVLDADAPLDWYDLRFEGLEGVALPPGDTLIGFHAGPTGDSARFYADAEADGHRWFDDAYDGGVADPVPAGTPAAGRLTLYMTVVEPFVVPDVDDLHLSRLPFELTQRIFSATGVTPDPPRSARCGWHDVATDDERGANAIVRSDGPLADLVGERILVKTREHGRDREVVVYVHEEQDWPDEITDEDLSITKRAWLELGEWSLESLLVTIEVIA